MVPRALFKKIGMLFPLVLLLVCPSGSLAQAHTTRQVAITIDDLPYADGSCDPEKVRSNTEKLLTPIRAQKVPLVGFVIGERCQALSVEQRRSLLRMWIDAGAELGNHTWTHPDLNEVSLDAYEAQILQTDRDLHQLLDPVRVRYFRAPYLHDGRDAATREQLQQFLDRHGYLEAPVTLDDDDWEFAAAYSRALKNNDLAQAAAIRDAYIPYMESIVEFFEKRSKQVLGRECSQVLLIHASQLNADRMPALLEMFRTRGYDFVTLEKAMSDPAYRIRDGYLGKKGQSWIHRWGLTNGKPIEQEPDVPDWIAKASQ